MQTSMCPVNQGSVRNRVMGRSDCSSKHQGNGRAEVPLRWLPKCPIRPLQRRFLTTHEINALQTSRRPEALQQWGR
jgi:hypothetical protein